VANSGRPDAGAGHGGPQLDRDEHRMGNAVRRRADSFDDARPGATIAGRRSANGRLTLLPQGIFKYPFPHTNTSFAKLNATFLPGF